MSTVKILHLSDLHLGLLPGKADSEKEVEDFFGSFFKLIQNEAIDFVAISGDISYLNNPIGFTKARLLISRLPGLQKDEHGHFSNLILCPGNHDLSQDVLKKKLHVLLDKIQLRESSDPPGINNAQFREKLIEQTNYFEELGESFTRYEQFCRGFLQPYSKHANSLSSAYTHGYRIIGKFCFLILNSAWFSTGGKLFTDQAGQQKSKQSPDQENLFIGKSLVKNLVESIKEEIAGHGKRVDDYIKIAVVHHPPSWLYLSERYANGDLSGLSSAWDQVLNFVDIILTGHEHIEVKKPSLIQHSSLLFQAGVSYIRPNPKNSFHPNSISLLTIDVNEASVSRQLYSCDVKTTLSGKVAHWINQGEDKVCEHPYECSTQNDCQRNCLLQKYFFRKYHPSKYRSYKTIMENPLIEPEWEILTDPVIATPQSILATTNSHAISLTDYIFSPLPNQQNLDAQHAKINESSEASVISIPTAYFSISNEDYTLDSNQKINGINLEGFIENELVKVLNASTELVSLNQKFIIKLTIKLATSSDIEEEIIDINNLISLKCDLAAITYQVINKLKQEGKSTDLRELLLTKNVKLLTTFE